MVPARTVAVVECVQRGRAGGHPGARGSHVLQRSLDAVVARHEVLRTTFRSVRGVPQAASSATHRPFELPFEQVSTEADVTAVAEREAAVPFDIAVGPLLRARLLVARRPTTRVGADDAPHRHGRLVVPSPAA